VPPLLAFIGLDSRENSRNHVFKANGSKDSLFEVVEIIDFANGKSVSGALNPAKIEVAKRFAIRRSIRKRFSD
tara:strand:- start:1166 stop:1384 length:219 start_codon:yes stop_codon:yes gene_type:complete